MASVRVAVVSRDPVVRMEAARAFDAAPRSWAVSLHELPPPDADLVVFGVDAANGEGIMFDPARSDGFLEEVRAAVETRAAGLAVAVTSPGGGTGATSVALHLAAATATPGATCVVDLDAGAGAASRLGIDAASAPTWDGRSPESLRLSALPTSGRFRLLVAPEASRGEAAALIRAAACEFERVIVDVSSAPLLESCAGACRAGVMVVIPTATSARRARAQLERLDALPWAVVVNRLGPGGEMSRSALQRILERPVALELPCAPGLRDSEDRNELLTAPWSRWRVGVGRLARALERA